MGPFEAEASNAAVFNCLDGDSPGHSVLPLISSQDFNQAIVFAMVTVCRGVFVADELDVNVVTKHVFDHS